MKIMVINGSPKKDKSNTLIITKAFLEGLSSELQTDINYIDIYDNNININACIGCYSCWTKTPGKCIFNDSMPAFLQNYIEADIIIWSFPLYYFGLPSKIKAFMDRLLPKNKPYMKENSASHVSRYDLSHQKTVSIVSGGLATLENNFEAVQKQFEIMTNSNTENYSRIFMPQSPLLSVEELKNVTSQYLENVKQAGKYYAIHKNIDKQLQEKLDEKLFPVQAYNEMADASWEINEGENDNKQAGPNLFAFTKQMASLYNPSNYKKDIVLEIEYTDFQQAYQIVMTKAGCEVIDKDFKNFTTKIETPFTVWQDVSKGKLSGSSALMEGLYKVKGDMDTMLNWDNYFGLSASNNKISGEKNATNQHNNTNMNLMLLPFITFWVAVPINHFYGALLSIIISPLIQIIFNKNRPTMYDKISVLLVAVFSSLSIIGASYNLILPLSYLCFAMLWITSLFTKIPLSAHYCNNDYGGEKAFENPIFMKTNKILTLCWGVLYLILAVFSFFAVKTSLQPYLVFINNAPPLFLGLFTKWFKNWYPKKVMSK